MACIEVKFSNVFGCDLHFILCIRFIEFSAVPKQKPNIKWQCASVKRNILYILYKQKKFDHMDQNMKEIFFLEKSVLLLELHQFELEIKIDKDVEKSIK
jgi:hypothetical protein